MLEFESEQSQPSISCSHWSSKEAAQANCPSWLNNFRSSSRLLRIVTFFAHVPSVLADTGDDFSNNLFSDLAPILALFGEQVAKQYMSQSMRWIEDLIFAVAPLGILTAITGAIRVGGPSYLKAIIGRAREGKGAIKLELMPSTSTDVCELWNGNGVSRVQGSVRPAPIMEVFYLKRAKERELTASEKYNEHQSVDDGLLHSNSWKSHSTEIYDFESGRKAGVLRLINNKESDQGKLDRGDTTQSCPPQPQFKHWSTEGSRGRAESYRSIRCFATDRSSSLCGDNCGPALESPVHEER
jgi:hypothetical protein